MGNVRATWKGIRCLYTAAAVLLTAAVLQAQFQVQVDLTHELQTMEGTGGNAYGWIMDPAKWSPEVLDEILNDLTVTHVRLRTQTKLWEPANDNGDPEVIDWSGFKDTSLVHQDFLLLQKLSDAGVQCVLGIWDVPDWMVENPGASKNRILPPERYPEFAELVAAYILYAEQQYGAKIAALSIQNEPNIGIYVYHTPQESADLSEVLLARLEVCGLSHVKLHIGDVNDPEDGIAYFDPSLQRPYLSSRASAVSFHTWEHMTIPSLEVIRGYAEAAGVPVWATEVGTSPLNSTTYDWALGSLKYHHMAIKYGGAALTFQWCLAGAESSVAPDGTPYPVFHALKHFHRFVKPGSVVVDTGAEPASLLTTAFVDKKAKRLSVVTLDTDAYSQAVTYTLIAPRTGFFPVEAWETTEGNPFHTLGKVDWTGPNRFEFYVQNRSIHTFTCRYNRLPSVSIQAEPSGTYPGYTDYVLVLEDPDGIKADYGKQGGAAGITILDHGVELVTVTLGDPDPPAFFQAFIDPSGTRLIMQLVGFPENLGYTLIGGGVDKDGGLALAKRGI